MKETASVVVRLYPSTRRKAKIEAAKNDTTIAAVIEEKFRKPVPHYQVEK